LYGEQANEMLKKTLEEFKKNTKYNKQVKNIDEYLKNWQKHIK